MVHHFDDPRDFVDDAPRARWIDQGLEEIARFKQIAALHRDEQVAALEGAADSFPI